MILGLQLLNVVLESAGSSLGRNAALVHLVQSQLCKFLLVHSSATASTSLGATDSLAVLQLSLRVIFNLFNSLKDHLKVQLEVFFTSVYLRIASSATASLELGRAEQKELVLESLLEFCREPALMQDLYTNYDCDVQVGAARPPFARPPFTHTDVPTYVHVPPHTNTAH